MCETGFEDRETMEVSVTMTVEFVERMSKQYPGALSPSDAIRVATDDAVTYREQEISPEDITKSVRKALEQGPIMVQTPPAKK